MPTAEASKYWILKWEVNSASLLDLPKFPTTLRSKTAPKPNFVKRRINLRLSLS
jgi:hypothetical protein